MQIFFDENLKRNDETTAYTPEFRVTTILLSSKMLKERRKLVAFKLHGLLSYFETNRFFIITNEMGGRHIHICMRSCTYQI
jgi:hypothetical protein